ncbi:hypothetical protein BGZ96_011444 [Linnemannia gamsii]|uniref:Uncharacterized protein n=1 Tax=Linnemannia gamsii TaxID=64522 RepID=A0ABQ7JSC1_9FUNG|nr:hypothetical protein BGZ96_011444 [Linnemannia gamsii]
MSSAKARSKGSPTSSPPLPPAPTQAKNRGSAAPHHYQTELASPEAAAAKAGGGLTPTRTRSNNNINSINHVTASTTTKQGAPHAPQAPPALTNEADVIHSTVLQKKSSLKRMLARVLVLYLGYSFFFVCPSLHNTRKTNLVCDTVARAENWLHPYAKPVVGKVGETYKTYAEPFVDQYGRPLYAQGQKYYVDVAQPAINTASLKAKDAYHQYAHPHVNKAYQTFYTPEVKAHVNRAQTAFNGYQKQAQEQLVYARKVSQDANDNVWRLHAAHVQPVVDKMTPHAKVAWNKALMGANRAYDTASDLYFTHVNPYAQQSYVIILDAADNARESFAFHTDEIWGTKLSKRHKKSKAARAADAAADKARQAKLAVEHTAQQAAKKLNKEPEPETFKNTLLKKAAEAQKLAEEYAEGAQKVAGGYSDSIKAAVYGGASEAKKATDKAAKDVKGAQAAAAEKAQGAQKVAEEFIENTRDAAAKRAQDAQKATSDEAQYLKKTADDKVHEAGKLSERIKKTVIEKAREAQEAVVRQAEHLRHAAQEQVDHVHEAGAHLRDNVAGAAYQAKEAVDKEAEYVADVAQKMKQQAENEARKLADQAARVAQETYETAADGVTETKDKVGKAAHDADQAIRHHADEASNQAQKAFVYVEEETEEARVKASKAAKEARKAASMQAQELRKAAEKAAHDGQEYLDVPADAAANAKNFVVQHAKDASDQAGQAAETAKQKVFNAGTASKASLAAMLAGIEASFGHFYEYEDTETKNLWSKLQSAIDEHVESAKKSAYDLEKANREAYESFESYVRDWRNQGSGDLEGRLAKLKQQSVESVKSIGQRAESDQTAAKSKIKILANNVDVYLNGLKDFLADRLEASKETIASDLNVFKDTSSKNDEETVRGKLAQLEAAARTRMDDAGKDAHAKAQQLLRQVDDIWTKSEVQSRELAAKTQELAKKASEDAQLMIQHAVGGDAVDDKKKHKKSTVEDEEAPGSLKSKIQSVKDTAWNRAHEAADKVEDILHERRDSGFSGSAVPAPGSDDAESANNVRVVMEEPGSGHRHHRY